MERSYILNIKYGPGSSRNVVIQKVRFTIDNDLKDDYIVYNFTTSEESIGGGLDSLDRVLKALKEFTINSTWEKCCLNSDNFNYFRESVLDLNDSDIYFTEEDQK